MFDEEHKIAYITPLFFEEFLMIYNIYFSVLDWNHAEDFMPFTNTSPIRLSDNMSVA
jgi:hypothetical protein